MTYPNLKILCVFIVLTLCAIQGCKKNNTLDDKIFLTSKNGFPESAKNLSIFNSQYDDYNSDLEPGVYETYAFIFSSNRRSQGSNYDLILYSLGIKYVFEEDLVSIYERSGHTDLHAFIQAMQPDINTSNNEYGPYIYTCNLNNDEYEREFLFFYTQENDNNLDIKYMLNELDSAIWPRSYYSRSGPFDASFLNSSEYNEAYISIQGDRIYYCSDNNGNYSIYQKSIPTDVGIIEFLNQSTDSTYTPVENINSASDDKCPYIVDDFMVFASNRAGGYGGYDLWYSELIDYSWSEPINFGSHINTEYDEFRPIFMEYEDIPNDLMIFSSNRPGGLGGFDLYYTGIDETR